MYFIVGKNIRSGVIGDDIDDNPVLYDKYFELGWELTGSRNEIIRMLQDNEITQDDIVVTVKDRMFLYTKIFQNVIPHSDFIKLNIPYNNINDLAIYSNPKFRFKVRESDLDLVLKVDTNIQVNYPVNDPFVCLLARFRSHSPQRNTVCDNLNELINYFYSIGVKVFVFGNTAEENLKNKKPHYVNLQEACYLMGLPNCKFVYGVMSGGMQLCLFCNRSKTIIYDNEGFTKSDRIIGNPLFDPTSVNFVKTSIIYVYENPVNEYFLQYLQ